MSGDDWNRAKRKRKLIEIRYEFNRPTLKVIKVTGKHLECMGIPVKGGYELYPEEAVYLLETGSAAITTSSGKELSLVQAFCILEVNSVEMYKYEVYKQVKRTGLVILRPRAITMNLEKIQAAEEAKEDEHLLKTFEMVMSQDNVPEEGVSDPNSFPTYLNENGQFSIHMKVLHCNRNLVNFLPTDVISQFPTVQVLQKIPVPTPKADQRGSCRPIYWPLSNTKNACNWTDFNLKMERKEHDLLVKRFRQLRVMNNKTNQPVSVENVDYHVFSQAGFSHRLPARPLFSMICCRATGPSLNVEELSKLRKVVFAVKESTKVNFISINGGSIDLNSYIS